MPRLGKLGRGDLRHAGMKGNPMKKYYVVTKNDNPDASVKNENLGEAIALMEEQFGFGSFSVEVKYE